MQRTRCQARLFSLPGMGFEDVCGPCLMLHPCQYMFEGSASLVGEGRVCKTVAKDRGGQGVLDQHVGSIERDLFVVRRWGHGYACPLTCRARALPFAALEDLNIIEEKLLLPRVDFVWIYLQDSRARTHHSVYVGKSLLKYPPHPWRSTNNLGDFPSIVLCFIISLHIVTLISLGSGGVPRS